MSTLKEVAEKAGVSISTVSRVINSSDKVNKQTIVRVKTVMSKLGYQPNRVAQRLRSAKKSKLLGVIIPDIQNPFYSNIVRGIEDVTYDEDYAVILCNSDENTAKERFYLDVLRSESVDGVILPPIYQYGNVFEGLADANIPLVCVDRKYPNEPVDMVTANNSKGAYSAVSHLIEQGHEKIAIITSSHQLSSFQERQQGYEQALKEHGIPIDNKLIKEADPRSSEDAKKITCKLLQRNLTPTALFTTNNLMTLGALEAITECGLKIPGDIAIVGFDDMPWATVVTPPLTVVRQPGYEMGRRAAELFFERIADPNRELAQITLDTQLVIRKSSLS